MKFQRHNGYTWSPLSFHGDGECVSFKLIHVRLQNNNKPVLSSDTCTKLHQDAGYTWIPWFFYTYGLTVCDFNFFKHSLAVSLESYDNWPVLNNLFVLIIHIGHFNSATCPDFTLYLHFSRFTRCTVGI